MMMMMKVVLMRNCDYCLLVFSDLDVAFDYTARGSFSLCSAQFYLYNGNKSPTLSKRSIITQMISNTSHNFQLLKH